MKTQCSQKKILTAEGIMEHPTLNKADIHDKQRMY